MAAHIKHCYHVRLDHAAIYLKDELVVMDATTGDQIRLLRRAAQHGINRARVAFHRSLFGSQKTFVPNRYSINSAGTDSGDR